MFLIEQGPTYSILEPPDGRGRNPKMAILKLRSYPVLPDHEKGFKLMKFLLTPT